MSPLGTQSVLLTDDCRGYDERAQSKMAAGLASKRLESPGTTHEVLTRCGANRCSVPLCKGPATAILTSGAVMMFTCIALLVVADPRAANLERHFRDLAAKPTLSTEEEDEAIRYLDDPAENVFSFAAEALKRTSSSKSIDALERFVISPSAFKAFRATDVLIERGLNDRYAALRTRLLSPNEPAAFRRELAWRFHEIDYDPKSILTAYAELLRSADVWLRYNAVMVLIGYGAPLERATYRKPTAERTIKAVVAWIAGLPKDWKPDRSYRERTICGIGVQLHYSSGVPVIVRVMDGLPAAQGGVEVGATLLEVDGDSVANKLPREISQYELLGACETTVRIKLQRVGGKAVQEKVLTRAPLRIPAWPPIIDPLPI
jgi:hypothetical protein